MSRLRAAQALDLAGKRDEALEQYKAVLARPNIYDSHEEAKRGLREPFKKGASATTSAAQAQGVESKAENEK
jgi:23S rRNA A1618 N6-methylase RlmF